MKQIGSPSGHFPWNSLLLIVGILLLLGSGYFLNVSDFLKPAIDTKVVASECDLRQGGCRVDFQGSQWGFQITPRNFDVLQPLQISLKKLSDTPVAPESVKVQFEGINMDMGYNLVKLQPVSGDLFESTGMLPDCTAETMYWLVHLIVVSGNERTDFQFRLQT